MTRFSYVAMPAFMFGYGIVRLIDGLDGSHGPGPAWTIGHLLFLIALALLGVVLFALRQAVTRHRAIATAAVVAGIIGLLAFVRSVVVDLIVGFQGIDRADMDRIYPKYDGFPGGLPTGLISAFDKVGPVLLLIGLLTPSIALVVIRPGALDNAGLGAAGNGRRLPWWSPVLLTMGFVLFSVDLDLIPVGAALWLLALLPLIRLVPQDVAVDRDAPTPVG